MRTISVAPVCLLLSSVFLAGCIGSIGSGEPEDDQEAPRFHRPNEEQALPILPPDGPLGVDFFDDKYFDGHVLDGTPTPILPPGAWDWNASKNDLANWRTFQEHIGELSVIYDTNGEAYGWRLMANQPGAVDYTGAAAYFQGSSGVDLVNLGAKGELHGFNSGLRCGPDRLVFNSAWSVDFSMSAADCDPDWDDDVVVAGCDANATSAFDIESMTIHTGRGSDTLFVRDAERAGFDAGNLDGKTSELDPEDGDDVAIFRGNMRDFRFFGGGGNDTAVWYVDEVIQSAEWLGPNFFGGGGSGGAVWSDTGTDRLVLVLPEDVELIAQPPTSEGQLLVNVLANYNAGALWDLPTLNDPLSKYCITCGVGPGGRKTMTLEYHSKDNKVRTGYFYVTAFEELQIGIGPSARVFRIDDVNGALIEDPTLWPYEPPALDPAYCEGTL